MRDFTLAHNVLERAPFLKKRGAPLFWQKKGAPLFWQKEGAPFFNNAGLLSAFAITENQVPGTQPGLQIVNVSNSISHIDVPCVFCTPFAPTLARDSQARNIYILWLPMLHRSTNIPKLVRGVYNVCFPHVSTKVALELQQIYVYGKSLRFTVWCSGFGCWGLWFGVWGV